MHDAQDFPGPLQPVLNELEAFDAIRIFLEAYGERELRAQTTLVFCSGTSTDRSLVAAGQWTLLNGMTG
jgi:hypothetical protein